MAGKGKGVTPTLFGAARIYLFGNDFFYEDECGDGAKQPQSKKGLVTLY